MKREIKFRGKRYDNRWVYGWITIPNGVPCIIAYGDVCRSEHQVIPSTVGQYTGLKDKDGVEIYEGDILLFSNMREKCTSIVMWNNEIGAWCLKIKDATRIGSFPLGKWLMDKALEVIGNIHDNPQLLNK